MADPELAKSYGVLGEDSASGPVAHDQFELAIGPAVDRALDDVIPVYVTPSPNDYVSIDELRKEAQLAGLSDEERSAAELLAQHALWGEPTRRLYRGRS